MLDHHPEFYFLKKMTCDTLFTTLFKQSVY